MKAGVSTACLYPDLLEYSLQELLINNINHVEIFVNTDYELRPAFIDGMADTLKSYNAQCKSLHPYTCAMEPMMFFSVYERRVDDAIEYYKKYFNAMNMLGAEIFVFHGNNAILKTSEELYFERFYRLAKAGREFGITVAQENVSRCQSGTLKFQLSMKREMGKYARFVLDTKQAIRAGEDPFETVDVLGDSIVHVHISDNGKKGDCLPIGKGEFDIKKFIQIMKNKGFDGSIMLELYRHNFSNVKELAEDFMILKKIIQDVEGGIL